MSDRDRDVTTEGAPLGESVNLETWQAQAPPADFAERVLSAVREEPPATTTSAERWRRPRVLAGVAGVVALAAGVALFVRPSASNVGEAIAKDRVELSIGERARVVLEPGASLKWRGDEVEQARGDVFYRVEPGARFRVRTPSAEVEVKGTCFGVRVLDMQKRDLKSGAVGAAAAAIALIGVYEGKVAVSHAGQRVEVGAGESVQTGEGALDKRSLADGQDAFDAKRSAASADVPLETANQNLVAQVGEYRRRLEALAEQKTSLESKLATTQRQLESVRADGSVPKAKHEYDLDAEEWKELAAQGSVKYRTPCSQDWSPSPDVLNRLGLAPTDAAVIKNAYARSRERTWRALKPVCAAALGSAEVAERLGPKTCVHLVLDVEQKKDARAASEAMALVGDIRAGVRSEAEATHPVAKVFLAMTAESKAFEADLAQTFGPEEAHRLTFAEEMCMSHSEYSGGRKP